MRATITRVAAAASIALVLGACSAEEPAEETGTPASATTSPSATATPSPSPTVSPTVDNTAIGEAIAESDTTARAILEGVWQDTPQEKREGTCQRWANTPEDVYEVPLFAEMDRGVVKVYFDEVCAAL